MKRKTNSTSGSLGGLLTAWVIAALVAPTVGFGQQVDDSVRWPEWAEKVYAGIEAARDQANADLFDRGILKRDGDKDNDNNKNDNDVQQQVMAWQEQWPALYELDTEVDMLAAALLALQHPAVVIDLYERWYRKEKGNQASTLEPFRTPAAILNYSRAHRDRAWQYLETPPLQLDRLKAFEKANQHMVKAFEKLEEARKSITAPQPGTFGYWLKEGLPRPESLVSWQNRNKGDQKSNTSKQVASSKQTKEATDAKQRDALGLPLRRPFPAFQALDYTVAFLEWEARIKRELGDVIYKATGGLSVQARGDNSNPTAVAYYIEAREVLYLARLIDGDNRRLLKEAKLVESRLKWLSQGLPYGGKDFFQFAPYSPADYWTVWKRRLEHHLSAMEADWRELRRQREKAAAWVNNIQEQDRNREMLAEQFKFQMNFALREKIADIRFDLVKTRTARAAAALQRLYDQSRQFTVESALQLDALVYKQELARERDRIIDEALAHIGTLRRGGALLYFRQRFFPPEVAGTQAGPGQATASQPLSDSNYQGVTFSHLERREDFGLVSGMASTDRRLSASWDEVVNSQAPGEIDRLASLWKAAQIRLQIAQADLRHRENSDKIEQLEQDYDLVVREIESIENEIASLGKHVPTNPESELAASVEQQIQRKIQAPLLDRLKREVDRANSKVQALEERIKRFQKYVRQTKKTIKTAREWGRRIEKAYDTFQSLTQLFSAIPATIAGPTGGVINDPAGSFERKGRAALDRINAIYKRLVASQSFDQLLDALDKESQKMQSSLAALRTDAERRLEALQKELARREFGQLLLVPPPEALKRIRAKIDAIRQTNLDKLRKRVEQIHTDFRRDVQGTLFEKQATEIGNRAAEAIESRLRELDKKLQAETDRAMEQVRQRFLEAVDEIRAWQQQVQEDNKNPNSGKFYVESAIQRAEVARRLEEAQTRRALLEGKRQALRLSEAAFEKEQLKRAVEEAQAKERAARAALTAAIIDQETAWLRLVQTAVRWNHLNNHAVELDTTIQAIQTKLEEFQKARKHAEQQHRKEEERQEQAEQEQIERIEALAAELQLLNKPEGRIVTADMLDRLAPALIAMEGISEAQQRLREGIDLGNAYLVEYARWLYLLSGERDCLIYGSACDTLGELKLSKQGLDEIAGKLQSRMGLARAGALAVRIPLPKNTSVVSFELVPTQPTTEPAFLTLVRHGSALTLRSSIEEGNGEPLAHIPCYQPSGGNRQGSLRRIEAVLQRPMLLCGITAVIALPRMNTASNYLHVRPVGFAKSGFAYANQFPFKYAFQIHPRAFAGRQTRASVASALHRFLRSENQLAAVGKSLLDNPGYAALPNVEFFGRSVEGRYRLELAEPLGQDATIEVFFFYITPATAQKPLPSARPLTIDELNLNHRSDNGQNVKAESNTATRSTAKANPLNDSFEKAWNNAKDAEKLIKSIRRRADSMRDVATDYENYILRTGTDPNPADLMRPISLSRTLKTADALLTLLSNDVCKRAEEPLRAAAQVVNNSITPNRKALTRLNTLVDTHNRRFRNLQKHVAKLKLLDAVVNGRKIVIEGETLDTLEQVTSNPEAMTHLAVYSIVRSLQHDTKDDWDLIYYILEWLKEDLPQPVETVIPGKEAP